MTEFPVIHEARVLVADLHGDGGVITATKGLIFHLDYEIVETYRAHICECNAVGKRAGLPSCHCEPRRRLEVYRTIRDVGRDPENQDDRHVIDFGSPFVHAEIKNLTPVEVYDDFGCFSVHNLQDGRAELVTTNHDYMLTTGLNRGDAIRLVQIPH